MVGIIVKRAHSILMNLNVRMGVAMVFSLLLVMVLARIVFTYNSPQPDFMLLSEVPRKTQLFVSSLFLQKVTPTPITTPSPTPAVQAGMQFISPTIAQEQPTNTVYPTNTVLTITVSPTKKPKNTPTPMKKPTKKPTQPPTNSCSTTSSEQYGSRGLNPPDLGANSNPDTVMSLRGWTPSNGELNLVTYGYPQGEPPDPKAPQLGTILGNGPLFSNLYRVLPDQKENSLAGLTSTIGQTVRAPSNGYNIGGGYQYMVVYVSDNEITMNVTGDDQAIDGYAIHMYGFCVDPNLKALYQQLDQQGRHLLPALYGGQKIGTANGTEVKVAIRDSGTFMDPRSRLDWWKGD